MAHAEEWISLRKFAGVRGVALSAVQKAIATGRVTSVKRADPKDPKSRIVAIELHQATAQWNSHTDPVEAAKSGKVLGSPLVSGAAASQPGEFALEPAEQKPAGGEGKRGDDDYYQSRATREKFAALTAEREYLEAIGLLVSVEDLRNVSASRYRAIRDKLLNIPDRVSAILAAEKEPARVHVALTAEIKRVLHELSDDAQAAAAQGAEERVAA